MDVSPDLLARRALLRRTETKFLVSSPSLASMLDGLSRDYGIFRACGAPEATYETLYFDTPDLRGFEDHRRGRRPRHKARVRHYIDRRVSYLEVKTKTNRNRTQKHRLPRPYLQNTLSLADRAFVERTCGISGCAWMPQLWTNFRRVTLVGLHTEERITVDMQLSFRRGGSTRRLEGVSVVEIKQRTFSARTPGMLVLRGQGLRPISASKYCTATIMLQDNARAGRLLPVLRQMGALHAR